MSFVQYHFLQYQIIYQNYSHFVSQAPFVFYSVYHPHRKNDGVKIIYRSACIPACPIVLYFVWKDLVKVKLRLQGITLK